MTGCSWEHATSWTTESAIFKKVCRVMYYLAAESTEYYLGVKAGTRGGWAQFCSLMSSTASFRSRPQPGDTPTRRPALDNTP